VLLESLDSALARGAAVLAEIIGFATLSDTGNIAHPDPAVMERCMRLALADAGILPSQVDYINAHATGTSQGDVAECAAIARVFGGSVPVSSFKGHMGHAMAASGSMELIAALELARENRLVPTLNLENIDPACGAVFHPAAVQESTVSVFVKNSFALGGVNSTLVVRRYPYD
ncbi:MAG: beta-ketoacyl-[acyl-carrier-protein] synthase family protein, partial [Desulfuromonadaceae bacterium]|nr:beta-ketoacyl-[acyl-carrier-protein] synthase family protein [Desulfuromonadaceae bacterium]